MKALRKILIITLSIALVCSSLWFVKINGDDELDFAITAPKEGALKAAGYIDITWEDASIIGKVNSYTVYIDGSEMTTTTERKYEFYTTKVNFHRVWVRANFADGTNHYTETVRFGVSKKGLAISTGMGYSRAKTVDMKVAWYYNWGTDKYSQPNFQNIEFVPMVWGDTSANTIKTKVSNATNAGYKYILGFNEPDMGYEGGGCNMDTEVAIKLWPNFLGYNINVGSPAYAMWPKVSSSKFPRFMAGVENKVDYVCLHCYPADWNGGKAMADWFLSEVVDYTWNLYHKPIWITEYSTSGNGITQDGTASFIENLLPGLDARDYVERQSFFSFNAETFGGGLWRYSNGELSKSGLAYASCGNPTTDYFSGDYINPRDEQPITSAAPTIKPVPTKPTPVPTTKKVKKPGKAKITYAKNKKKKKILLKLKKIKGAKGYQIKYSDSKKYDGYWTKSTTKRKVYLKKLDKNTKYYIKARAYKLVNGHRLYGKFSKTKKVKVKK